MNSSYEQSRWCCHQNIAGHFQREFSITIYTQGKKETKRLKSGKEIVETPLHGCTTHCHATDFGPQVSTTSFIVGERGWVWVP